MLVLQSEVYPAAAMHHVLCARHGLRSLCVAPNISGARPISTVRCNWKGKIRDDRDDIRLILSLRAKQPSRDTSGHDDDEAD
jgi:hypothetical protein